MVAVCKNRVGLSSLNFNDIHLQQLYTKEWLFFFPDLHCFRDFFSFRVCISLKKGLQILKTSVYSYTGWLAKQISKDDQYASLPTLNCEGDQIHGWLGLPRISKLPKFPNWTQSWLWVQFEFGSFWINFGFLGWIGLTLTWLRIGLLKSWYFG